MVPQIGLDDFVIMKLFIFISNNLILISPAYIFNQLTKLVTGTLGRIIFIHLLRSTLLINLSQFN